MAAGDIGAALAHLGVEAVGQRHDEIVGLGILGGLDHLLLSGVRAAPQQILADGAREEDVVLKHHADAGAELIQGIVTHVHPVHQDSAVGDVVKPGDQVHQRGLSGTGTAHHSQELAGADGEVDVGENILPGAPGLVLEVHMAEFHLALGRRQRVGAAGAVLNGGLGLQHLVDSAGAGNGAGELQQTHSQHHDAHQNLEDIGDKGGEVADEHAAGHHSGAAQVEHGGGGAVEGDHHDGHHGDDSHIHIDGGLGQVVVGFFKFGLLVARPDKGLHHPDPHQILLHGAVQGVDAGLKDLEKVVAHTHEHADSDHQQGDGHQHDHGQPGVDADGHGQGGHQHHGGSDQHPQRHGDHHLDGIDIVGDPGDEGGGGEVVDVREGKLLYLVINAPAQIGAKALARHGGQLGAEHAAEHAAHGQHQHDAAHL